MARAKRTYFPQAPAVTPYLNVSSLFDIYTGTYYFGKHGESILNGGIMPMMGYVAEANFGKSTLMNDMFLRVMSRHPKEFEFSVYDTENLAQRDRYQKLAKKYPTIADYDWYDPEQMSFSRGEDIIGNKWLDAYKDYILEKKEDKTAKLTSPFINPHTNENVEWFVPSFQILDSLSALRSDATDKMFDGTEAGDKERNTFFMKDGLVKTQMLIELKDLLPISGNYFGTVVHLSETVNMDGKPERKELNYIRQGLEMKNAPAKFKSYTHACYYIHSVSSLMAADKNGPQYPRNKEDDLRQDTDLLEMNIIPLRNKQGKSGIPFKLIYSQSEGIQWSLSDYHFCKDQDYYGIGGNRTTFFMDLYPDVKLMRTTIRGKIAEDPLLCRALEITAELCMMNNLWSDPAYLAVQCTPKELYDDLKAMGYDWNVLLNTRGYWLFVEEEKDNPLPFLSTMDLLRMRKGLYKPYWMEEKQ